MIKKLLLIILIGIPFSANAVIKPWKINSSQSSITFAATQNNAPVKGKFNKFNGTISFDPAHLDESHVRIIVDMGSVATSYSDVANTLKSPDWFDIKLFPQAVFDAKHFTKVKDNNFKADGTLTIRDKTIPISLFFILEKYSETEAFAKGNTTLKRTLFGVGNGQWANTKEIKDEVEIKFEVTAER